MSPEHHAVVVIGAGTGGLALAHGLVREGVDVAVYERDATRRDGLNGYRVGISPDGSRALHALLPPDLFATFVATCARPTATLAFLDRRLRTLLQVGETDGLELGSGPVDSEKSVSRMTLRQVLLTGLEEIVHFDKRFDRYEQLPDGRVMAFFTDGNSVTADLLVGADGTNSRVRGQMLPHALLADTGIRAVAGKVPLTPAVRALLPEPMVTGITLLFAPHGYSLVTHCMEFPWAGGAPKSGIGSTDTELIRQWPGLLFDNTSDYFMWGFSAARTRMPVDLMKQPGDQLLQLVLGKTRDWHPDLRKLLSMSDPGSTFPLQIRTSVPVAPWPSGPVTLLGDAIHTMTPGRGVGANTALLDALLLCHELVSARDGRKSQLQAVADYEQTMRSYAFEAVEQSLKQMTADQPLHHPVLGGPTLLAMQTSFRLMNRIPAMRRKLAASETRLRDRRAHPALAAVL